MQQEAAARPCKITHFPVSAINIPPHLCIHHLCIPRPPSSLKTIFVSARNFSYLCHVFERASMASAMDQGRDDPSLSPSSPLPAHYIQDKTFTRFGFAVQNIRNF